MIVRERVQNKMSLESVGLIEEEQNRFSLWRNQGASQEFKIHNSTNTKNKAQHRN